MSEEQTRFRRVGVPDAEGNQREALRLPTQALIKQLFKRRYKVDYDTALTELMKHLDSRIARGDEVAGRVKEFVLQNKNDPHTIGQFLKLTGGKFDPAAKTFHFQNPGEQLAGIVKPSEFGGIMGRKIFDTKLGKLALQKSPRIRELLDGNPVAFSYVDNAGNSLSETVTLREFLENAARYRGLKNAQVGTGANAEPLGNVMGQRIAMLDREIGKFPEFVSLRRWMKGIAATTAVVGFGTAVAPYAMMGAAATALPPTDPRDTAGTMDKSYPGGIARDPSKSADEAIGGGTTPGTLGTPMPTPFGGVTNQDSFGHIPMGNTPSNPLDTVNLDVYDYYGLMKKSDLESELRTVFAQYQAAEPMSPEMQRARAERSMQIDPDQVAMELRRMPTMDQFYSTISEIIHQNGGLHSEQTTEALAQYVSDLEATLQSSGVQQA